MKFKILHCSNENYLNSSKRKKKAIYKSVQLPIKMCIARSDDVKDNQTINNHDSLKASDHHLKISHNSSDDRKAEKMRFEMF